MLLLGLVLHLPAQTGNKTEKEKEDSASGYFDVNAGVSNGYFSPKTSNTNDQPQSKLFYSVGTGYFSPFGLNLSVLGMLTQDLGSFSLYQTAITPGFDFNKGKTWGGGLSYTRYITKDSTGFYISPLKNEFYGYLTYKPGFLVPTLAVNYAAGTQKDVLTTQRRTVSKTTKVHDISILSSVKHVFDLGSVFSSDDAISFTPTVMAITGTNTYGANLLGSKLARFTSNKRAATLAGSTTASKFALQYISLYFDFEYSVGKFYLQPQLVLDYTVPKSESQWNAIFGLTAGFDF